jgi:hypothetical protein
MAYEISNYSLKITLVAGADLSTAQYKFVKQHTDGTAILCAAATDRPIGVLQNSPASGQEAEVLVTGGTKVKTAAGIAIGALIGTDGNGLADAKVPGTDTTEYAVGTVLVATANANEIGTAVINCAAPSRAA